MWNGGNGIQDNQNRVITGLCRGYCRDRNLGYHIGGSTFEMFPAVRGPYSKPAKVAESPNLERSA